MIVGGVAVIVTAILCAAFGFNAWNKQQALEKEQAELEAAQVEYEAEQKRLQEGYEAEREREAQLAAEEAERQAEFEAEEVLLYEIQLAYSRMKEAYAKAVFHYNPSYLADASAGNFLNTQSGLINSFRDIGFKQTQERTEIESVVVNEDGSATLIAIETILEFSDTQTGDRNKYKSTYRIELLDGVWTVTDLLDQQKM